jgi:WD40 repeat protein
VKKGGHAIYAIRFLGDGQKFISGDFEGPIDIWDCATLRKTASFPTGHRSLASMELSADKSTLVTAGVTNADHQTVCIWDVKERRKRMMLQAHRSSACVGGFSQKDKKFITTGDDGIMALWDTRTGKKTGEFGAHSGRGCVAVSPDGTRAIADSGPVTLWDLDSRKPIWTVKLSDHDPLKAVAFSPDGKLVAGGISRGMGKYASGTPPRERSWLALRAFLGVFAASRFLLTARPSPRRALLTGSCSGEWPMW